MLAASFQQQPKPNPEGVEHPWRQQGEVVGLDRLAKMVAFQTSNVTSKQVAFHAASHDPSQAVPGLVWPPLPDNVPL